jgi:hypothetical protein
MSTTYTRARQHLSAAVEMLWASSAMNGGSDCCSTVSAFSRPASFLAIGQSFLFDI